MFSNGLDVANEDISAHTAPLKEHRNCSDLIFLKAMSMTGEGQKVDFLSPILIVSLVAGILEMILVILMIVIDWQTYKAAANENELNHMGDITKTKEYMLGLIPMQDMPGSETKALGAPSTPQKEDTQQKDADVEMA